MKSCKIEYGDTMMEIEVPESATILSPEDLRQDPPTVDPYEETQRALENPLNMSPLKKLASPGKKAIILCPDRVKGGAHKEAHRKVCIPLIIQELKKGGIKKQDITLMICSGLHRKNTKEELDWYLGENVVNYFWPDRLTWHDCEDKKNLVNFGYDELGDVIEVGKSVVDADIAISIGHVLGNPYGGYSGGYKMIATGMTSWRSIADHHNPSVMHAPEFIPVNHTTSGMRKRFDAIGKAIEKGMGKKFFFIDAVLGTDNQVLGVFCGDGDEVQKESWKLADKRTNVYLDIEDKFDILVFGEPRVFHYGPGHGTNPILMLQAIGAQFTRNYDVLRENGVIITASLCNGWFNDEWFPSYKEIYDKLQKVANFSEVMKFAEEVSNRPEYIYKYRYCYAYGAFHGFSMVSCGSIAHNHTSAVYIAGAREPGYARGMGCIPKNSFKEALIDSEKYVGKNPRILVLPGVFAKPGFHTLRK